MYDAFIILCKAPWVVTLLTCNPVTRAIHKKSPGRYRNANRGGSLPVSRESCESEHRHPDRGELDEGDDLTAHPAEQPLLGQVAAGVHRSAGHQQQHVPERQAGHEEVGHVARGLGRGEGLDEGDVADQTQHADDTVHRGDGDAGEQHRPRRVLWRGVRASGCGRLVRLPPSHPLMLQMFL